MGLSARVSPRVFAQFKDFTKPSIPHRCRKALVDGMSVVLACHLGISLAPSHFFHKIFSTGILPEKTSPKR
jgi:hypothetical protein